MSAEKTNEPHEANGGTTRPLARRRTPDADPLIGQTLGRYHILGALGRGAASVVYLAEASGVPLAQLATEPLPNDASPDDNAPTRYAVKALAIPKDTPDEEREALRLRFQRETQIAQHLRHPHILVALDSGFIEGSPYVVMPYIVGPTLARRLSFMRGPLELDETIRYVTQVASALDYAHAHGVIHRDVKPSNLLLDGDFSCIYLTDFGIASLQDSGERLLGPVGDPTTLTIAGTTIGTPSYMAPEQIKGEAVGPATDIYALGVVTYQLVTGETPFQGKTPLQVAARHVSEEPPAPRRLRADLPAPAEEAILKALAKSPQDRFTAASAFAEALAVGLRGERLAQPRGRANLRLAQPLHRLRAFLTPEASAQQVDGETPSVSILSDTHPMTHTMARLRDNMRRAIGLGQAFLRALAQA
jgi:serine/threonine protein kinase